MEAAWNWLVENGLWRDVLAAVVALIVGNVFALRTIRKAFRRHAAGQERISDLLDTSTPGGLAEVVGVIRQMTHPAQAAKEGSTMPYRVEPDPDADGSFRVVNTGNGDIKGTGMTRANAEKQLRLLEGIEHGWEPAGRNDPRWGGPAEENTPVEYRSAV